MYIHVFAKTSVAFFSKLRRDGVSEETRKSTFHKYLHTQYAYTSSHIHVQLNPDIGAELVKGNMAPICGLAPNLKVHFHGFLQKSPEFSNVLLEDAIVAPISRKN